MRELNETILQKPILEETSREKLPEGVLCRVVYPICNIGKKNANRRVYEKAVWDKVLSSPDIQEKLKNRALFGQAEHPAQTQSDLQLTSHVIFEMWIDEEQGKVFQKMDVLDTPTGRVIDTLLRAGCNVGVSTRAEGDLEEAEDEEGTYHRVVPESYKYITTDFTADPSTFGAVPQEIKRNIVTEIKKEVDLNELKKGERNFVSYILESIEKGGGEKQEDKSVSEEKHPYEDFCDSYSAIVEEEVVDETKEIKKMYQDAGLPAPDGKGIHTKAFHELAIKIAKDYVKKGDSPKEALSKAYPIAMKQLGKEKAVKKAHRKNESVEDSKNYSVTYRPDEQQVVDSGDQKSEENHEVSENKEESFSGEQFNSLVDKIVDLKVAEASVRVERDKALEMIKELKVAKEELEKQGSKKAFENKILISKMKALAEKSCATISALKKKLEEKASQAKKFSEELNELKKKYSKKVRKLEESIEISEKNLEEEFKRIERKITEDVRKDFIRQFVRIRIAETGLKMDSKTQALLEKCYSLEEVDATIEELRDARRRSALHSEPIKEIDVVSSRPRSVEDSNLDKCIGKIFEGFGYMKGEGRDE